MAGGSRDTVLTVEDLRTVFETSGRAVRAVDGVSFEVARGERIGIVGESGCGKTMTAMSIMGLVQKPGRIASGRILFGNGDQERDVLRMTPEELREFRGRDVAIVFQDPMSSLNPTSRIGVQIEETMAAHDRFTDRQARARVLDLLSQVKIPEPAKRAGDYPHQFSGGMRQRAMIAMALSNKPQLLIADEPTTALDVTVQAEIIELLNDLSEQTKTAVILITHNLAIVAAFCTRVLVMYAGRIVEQGTTAEIFGNPQHPYTWSLLRSIPRADTEANGRLLSIPGMPPDLGRLPDGCKFHPRCPFVISRCRSEEPPLEEISAEHRSRCWVQMRNTSEDARSLAYSAEPGA